MAIGSVASQFQAAEFTSWPGFGVQVVPVEPPVELLPPVPVPVLLPVPELLPVPVPPVPLPELLPVPVVSVVVVGLAQPNAKMDPTKAKRTRDRRIRDLLRSMNDATDHAKRFGAQY